MAGPVVNLPGRSGGGEEAPRALPGLRARTSADLGATGDEEAAVRSTESLAGIDDGQEAGGTGSLAAGHEMNLSLGTLESKNEMSALGGAAAGELRGAVGDRP